MTRVLLTGATGTLGSHLQEALSAGGYDLRLASRSPPTEQLDEWVRLDLAAGTGIEEAVDGVNIIVHAASDAQGDSEAVDRRGTGRLLDAAEDAGIELFTYVSIVGVDEIPYSYYEHKRAAERAVQESSVSSQIVRSTQFHQFIALLLGKLRLMPIWPLPTGFRLQPIDAAEVATAIVAGLETGGTDDIREIGGPEVLTVGELARTYRTVLGTRRLVLPIPLPGAIARGFKAGRATCPDNALGERTWEEWLRAEYSA